MSGREHVQHDEYVIVEGVLNACFVQRDSFTANETTYYRYRAIVALPTTGFEDALHMFPGGCGFHLTSEHWFISINRMSEQGDLIDPKLYTD